MQYFAIIAIYWIFIGELFPIPIIGFLDLPISIFIDDAQLYCNKILLCPGQQLHEIIQKYPGYYIQMSTDKFSSTVKLLICENPYDIYIHIYIQMPLGFPKTPKKTPFSGKYEKIIMSEKKVYCRYSPTRHIFQISRRFSCKNVNTRFFY